MKKHFCHWATAVGIAAAGGFTSCYAPYPVDSGYSQPVGGDFSGGDSKSGGYGEGYGYGSPGFTTSYFVGTGNPQWGYDPYCYSYYDYYRRCYYDPYLYGYYPLGYRPMRVYGCPHPYGYGWRAGVRYCAPPRYVRNVTVVNYHNRATMYRNSSYGWAKQVRQMPETHGRVKGERPATNSSSGHITGSRPSTSQSSGNRPVTGTRPSTGSSSHQAQGGNHPSNRSAATAQSSNRMAPTVGSRPTASRPAVSSQKIQSNSGQHGGRVKNQSRQSYSGGGGSGRGQSRQSSGGGGASHQSQSQNSNGGKGKRGY